MSVCGHGRHHAPRLAVRVVTLHRVEGLESVSAAHHIEAAVEDGYTKLKPPSAHRGHLRPPVLAQAVLLNAGGTWRGNKTTARCSNPNFKWKPGV